MLASICDPRIDSDVGGLVGGVESPRSSAIVMSGLRLVSFASRRFYPVGVLIFRGVPGRFFRCLGFFLTETLSHYLRASVSLAPACLCTSVPRTLLPFSVARGRFPARGGARRNLFLEEFISRKRGYLGRVALVVASVLSLFPSV